MSTRFTTCHLSSALSVLLKVVLLSTLCLFAVSCDDDDNQPAGQFSDGVFILNEGNFQSGNGSVSYFGTDGTATHDIFGLVNNARALGDVVQSMTIADSKGFIVVNNSNKVEVVNPDDFQSITTIANLSLPRFFSVYNGKGYVTEWVSFTEKGRVSVIDLTSYDIIDQVTTDFGAENLIAHNDLIYVSNNFTSTVSVIDPSVNEVIKTIEVADAPGELLVDAAGMIWVVCAGAYEADNGALVQIDPSKSKLPDAESVSKTIALGKNVSAKAAISNDGSKLFIMSGNSVYAVSVSATAAPGPLMTEPAAADFYAIGIDPRTNILYVGDSEGFSGAGTIFRYDISGTSIDQFSTGIGPTDFAFND